MPHRSRIRIKDAAGGRFQNGVSVTYGKKSLFIEMNSLFKPGAEAFVTIKDEGP